VPFQPPIQISVPYLAAVVGVPALAG
jgi:hypothetical protein